MVAPVILKPHQEKAFKELDNGKILVGGVGSGKTFTAIAYYVARESPRDVVVITTARKRDDLDWQKEFVQFGVGRERDATFHGTITVDSWNNIGKYVDVKDAFFIFDEQRLVGSGAWTKSFYKIAKANRWILLSATPGDTWVDYIPVFVANGYYKNRTEFKRRHVVYSPFSKYPKILRYLEVGVLVRRKNSIQVKMPYERHTTRHIHEVEVAYDQDLVREVMVKRWNIFKDEPMKDIADLFRVTRKIVNSDPSRLNAVRTLLEKHPRLIVFYNFDYELEALRSLDSEILPSRISEKESPRSTTSTSMKSDTSWSPGSSKPTSLPIASSDRIDTTRSLENGSVLTLSPNQERKRGISPTVSEISSLEVGEQWQKGKLSSLVNSSSQPESIAVPGTAITTAPTESKSSTHSSISGSRKRNTPESVSTSDSNTGSSTSSKTSELPSSSSEAHHSPGLPKERTSHSRTTASNDSGGLPIRDTLVVAEWNGHKHQPVPTSDRWVYLVQYVAGAEGWNCITTDATVFYSLTYSYKNWHQAFGRIDRLNTPFVDLNYYVLQSKSWIDLAIRKALNAKKSFNEASFGVKSR